MNIQNWIEQHSKQEAVIEFNYFIHNCLDPGSLANDEERLRRDGCIHGQR